MADTKVLDNGARIQYVSGGETVFVYPFFIPPSPQGQPFALCVFYTPVGETPDAATDKILEGVGYTVQGAGEQNGGTITLLFPTNAGDIITIIRNIPLTQDVLFGKSTVFRGETVDAVHNKEMLVTQQVDSKIETRGLLYEPLLQLGAGQTTLPKLPPTDASGIKVWSTNSAGNLVASTLEENPDCSTLRSQLISTLVSAPGTDLVGSNVAGLGPQILTQALALLVQQLVLSSQDPGTPGSDEVGTNVPGHGPLTLTALLAQLSQGDDSRSENLLLNGAFEFWQRGFTFTPVGAQSLYVSDKWAYKQTEGTTTAARINLENASLSLGFSSNFALKITRTVDGTPPNVITLQQPIEDVHIANGRTVSVSVDILNNNAPSLEIEVEWVYVFDGSTDIVTSLGTFTVPQGFKNNQLVFQLPPFDPAGKVIGLDSHSLLRFKLTDQGLFDFSIFNASIEIC